jgi:hypothetical protein
MKVRNLLLVALVLPIVGIASIIALPAQTRTQPASAAQYDKYDGDCTGKETDGRCADKPFDPANCQYPDRWSNPVGGCDNSDPAVPECIKSFSTKAGEDACIAAFVAEQAGTPPVTPTPTNQCGGGK